MLVNKGICKFIKSIDYLCLRGYKKRGGNVFEFKNTFGASRVPHPTSSQVSLCALIFLFGKSALLRETCSSPTKIHGFLSVILFDWLYGTAPSTHRLHTTRQNGQTLFARFAINHYFYKINICVLLSYSISSISGKRRKC